ncbi:HNH endonuclease [Thermodesulfatator indicus DSM 15286]|uniref:HNH endonuclease n=1 Tax=Thermodesulfatator indicus (strain DSM 15286 / JCM 11887 / CIR29812) TaxID=667014 RepID=F8AA91_THEID|nr:HNH endonuclease [Thermodesulfatator indicus]AEH44227.1 HNH endonuclease [Thermodesulfatator indicus DSM 15286]
MSSNGSILSEKVLVLNRSYQAVQITTVQRAICHLVKGTAKVITPDWTTHTLEEWILASQFYANGNGHRFIRSPNLSFLAPDAIYLTTYDRLPRVEVVFSRANLMMRDRYTCQYCGKSVKNPKDRTIDHIIPRSRGGKTTWENVVLCCRKCNIKKGNRTPEEAGMKLLSKPKAPRWESLIMEDFPKEKQKVWRHFLDFAGLIEF